jgi:hypothetical protein
MTLFVVSFSSDTSISPSSLIAWNVMLVMVILSAEPPASGCVRCAVYKGRWAPQYQEIKDEFHKLEVISSTLGYYFFKVSLYESILGPTSL